MKNRKKHSGFMILIGFICLAGLSFCLLQALYSNGLIQRKIEYQSKSDLCLYQITAQASGVVNAVGFTNAILNQLKHFNRASYMIDIFFPGYGKTVRVASKKMAQIIVRFQNFSIRIFDLSKHLKTIHCSMPMLPSAKLENLRQLTKRPRSEPGGVASPLFWKSSKRPVFKLSIFHKDFNIETQMTLTREDELRRNRLTETKTMIEEGYSPQYL